MTRPSLPVALWILLGAWTAAFLAEEVAWRRLLGADGRALGYAAMLAPVALALLGARRPAARRLCFGVACGVLVGGLASGAYWQRIDRGAGELARLGSREWRGVVVRDPEMGAFGERATVRLEGDGRGLVVSVAVPAGASSTALGRCVAFRALVTPIDPAERWARAARRGGEAASAKPWTWRQTRWRSGVLGALLSWRERTRTRISGIRGSGGDLLVGILLGDRRRVADTVTQDDFRTLGLSHILAVSGDHLALAFAAALALARATGARRRGQILVALAAGCAFAVVTGLQMSALRALGMAIIASVGALSGRRTDPIASLSVAALVILAIDPPAAFDIGFQLSVLAVGGLVVFGGLATAWFEPRSARLRGVADTLALTTVAQVATLPLVVSQFHTVPLLAPLANVLVLPLIPPALYVGLSGAIASLVAPRAGWPLLLVAAKLLGLAAGITERLASVPRAAVAVSGSWVFALALVGVLAALYRAWPLPRRAAPGRRAIVGLVVPSLALALGSPVSPSASLTVLDVGQGDAILYRDGGQSMLVDTGPSAGALRAALAKAGVRALDVVVLTHAHADHVGGLLALAGLVHPRWVGFTAADDPRAFAALERRGARLYAGDWLPVRRGMRWRIGQSTVTAVWPSAETTGVSTNDTSVILLVSRGSFDALLTGDAERVPQERLIADGLSRDIDVLKVPHHGSANGLIDATLAAWRPRLALISVGARNDFGHPSASTLAILRAHGIETHRTDVEGELTVRISGDSIRLATSRRSRTTASCETIGGRRSGATLPAGTTLSMEWHGNGRTRGSAHDVSHPRLRGPAPRGRGPPAARAAGAGRRSRLQL